MSRYKLYYSRGANFGDAINPLIFERVLGLPVSPARRTSGEIIGIGTMLNALLKQEDSIYRRMVFGLSGAVTVYSTGISGEWHKHKPLPFRKMNFSAVRGRLTLREIQLLGLAGPADPVALGDAGLLVPHLLMRPAAKTAFCGIIPHVLDSDLSHVYRLSERIRHSRVIDSRQHPMETLKQIASCECVVSSSLHGLVAADALGIPNRRVRFSDNPRIGGLGGDFKFHDYCSVYSSHRDRVFDLRDPAGTFDTSELLTDLCAAPQAEVRAVQDNLLAAARRTFG